MAPYQQGAKRARSESVETIQSTPNIKTGKSEGDKLSVRDFACPFCKHSEHTGYDIDASCLVWHNPNIDTVIRHHILGTHRRKNNSLSKGDAGWIPPLRFEKLEKWRETVRLGKKLGPRLWADAYAILFTHDKLGRQHVPDPWYSHDSTARVTKLHKHLSDRALDNPEFVQSAPYLMMAQIKKILAIRDQKVAEITQRFSDEIRALKSKRDDALRQVMKRSCDEITSVQQPFEAELTKSTPRRINSDKDVSLTGSAPSQYQIMSTTRFDALPDHNADSVPRTGEFKSPGPSDNVEDQWRVTSPGSVNARGTASPQRRRRGSRQNSRPKSPPENQDECADDFTELFHDGAFPSLTGFPYSISPDYDI